MEYKVVYEIEVDAESPKAAAEKVEDYMKRGKYRPHLIVTELASGELTGIDLEEEIEMRYLNHYECDKTGCGEVWDDEWSCMCDDRCPKCNTSMSPIRSEEI